LRYKKDLSPERLEEMATDLYEAAEICARLDEKMTKLKASEKRNPILK
jgi:ppGpp synthetase/RelA/SpoT-type nucleotidyltranferase